MRELVPLPKPVMSTHDVIDFVASYYGQDLSRRSVGNGKCYYNGPNGCQCAFALFVANPEVLIEQSSCSQQHNAVLRDEVKHLGARSTHARFWVEVQNLHDSNANWHAPEGLSAAGRAYVANLKLIWRNVEN